MTETTVAVETRGLVKQFGDVRALDGFDMRLDAGEIHGLVGPNGAGKTTLLRVLFGLVTPDEGSITLLGEDWDPADGKTRQGVGGFVEEPRFYPYLSARRNLELLADLDGVDRGFVPDVLDLVAMSDRAGRKVGGFSSGMRQRLGLAASLLRSPSLLLLDEPTVGLDPITALAVLDLIRGPLRARGQTILLTDHQSAEMEAIADQIAVLGAGAIALLGTPRELRARFGHLAVIEIHTEAMDLPTGPRPGCVVATEQVERPGALEVRAWRIHVLRSPNALEAVLAWLTQPTGRVVFVAESEPTLQDVLALPNDLVQAPETPAESREPKAQLRRGRRY
jgi:ABC-type multidrug transport system ATPase subunit